MKNGKICQRNNKNNSECCILLVGMADQVEACLKMWEGIMLKDDENIVGSVKHDGYSNVESGTILLIGTVCKAVRETGCEKLGCMASFETFMKDEYGMSKLPLFLFL